MSNTAFQPPTSEAYVQQLQANFIPLSRSLLQRLSDNFNGLPSTYLVADVETSGFLHGVDFLLQIGHCLVMDRKVVDRQSFMLDWRRVAGVDTDWLQNKLRVTTEDMLKKGVVFPVTWKRLCEEGVDPIPVLRDYRSWLEEIRSRDMFTVLHNGYNFDVRMLVHHFQKFLGQTDLYPRPFGDNNLLDTGIILKAAQMGENIHDGESLREFSARVGAVRRKGVFWSLSDFAVPQFKLAEKHGLDMKNGHDAGFDAYLCHLLLEEFRELTGV